MTKETFRVRLVLIRHAQSEANTVQHLICGRSPLSPLSSRGQQESILLGKRLKYEQLKVDHVISSTAVRAKQTADILLQNLHFDTSQLILSDALVEQSQGEWEGLERALTFTNEVLKQLQELHMEFSSPNGESMRMVQRRAIDFLQPWIQQAKEESRREKRDITILVITHANLIRTVLQYYLELNPKHTWLIDQQNTTINEIQFSELGTNLIKINDHAHLNLLIPHTVSISSNQKNFQ